jgi:CRISPR system Cascade subunit CasA
MNIENMYNLLENKLLSVGLQDGSSVNLSLTDVMHSLSTTDNIVSFSALQPHQQQSWYCFLVQLAAMAAARENHYRLPDSVALWKEVLLKLSGGSESAWFLVVPDLNQPAFFQNPISNGGLQGERYKADVGGPDDLDIIITSKNHDVKSNRTHNPKVEHWIFALINLQTMDGVMGRGNYGIIRMNGGFGSRPFIGYSKNLSFPTRFRRDIEVLLLNRENTLSNYTSNGYALLWTEPWDGGKEKGLPINKCDPWFIEICRRIRFVDDKGKIVCYRANSEAKRIKAPDELNGMTGDPWAPIDLENLKSLTLGDGGFSYELIHKIIFKQGYNNPISMSFLHNDNAGTYLICQGLVRGQGKTGGLHKRIILVPGKVARLLFQEPSLQDKLAGLSATRITMSQEISNRVLRQSVALLQTNATSIKADTEKVQSWLRLFDTAIDMRFFDSLWDSVSLSNEEARQQWAEVLFTEAEKIYLEAERSVPMAQLRRYRIISSARALFYSKSRDVLDWPPQRELVQH